jgi:pimeloyl-ACP methyl ester carboxylesterase
VSDAFTAARHGRVQPNYSVVDPVREGLARVRPAWGARDRVLPPRQAARAQAMIPGARLVQLPDCGHIPMNDAPDLVARVILEAIPSAVADG